jgi:hypothetical protein
MSRSKRTAKRRGRKKAVPTLGAAGAVSLLLVGSVPAGASAEKTEEPASRTSSQTITLSEEEISDVSLGTFPMFDKEIVKPASGLPQFVQRGACTRPGRCSRRGQ